MLFTKKVKAKEELNNYIYKQKKEAEKMSESKKNKIIAKLEDLLNWIKGNDTASVGIYKNKLNEIKMFVEN